MTMNRIPSATQCLGLRTALLLLLMGPACWMLAAGAAATGVSPKRAVPVTVSPMPSLLPIGTVTPIAVSAACLKERAGKDMGHWSYCSTTCPCDVGEGDCDDHATHTDCAGDLICGVNNGENWGMGSSYDVCVRAPGAEHIEAGAYFEGDIDVEGDIGIVQRNYGAEAAAAVLKVIPRAAPAFQHAGFVNGYAYTAPTGIIAPEYKPPKAAVSPTKSVALRGNAAAAAGPGGRNLGAHNDAQRLWPLTVAYSIDSAFSSTRRQIILDAVAAWESTTCINFVARNGHEDYIYFDSVTSGCSSPVGRQGGMNRVKLASGCSKGSTIHEIGHSLGFWHEQSRSDRDAHVTINWDNIKDGKEHNFKKQSAVNSLGSPYDYGSIMHYGRSYFSTGGDTITTVDPAQQSVIGQRTALSDTDIAQMNELYSCDQTCPTGYYESYSWAGTAPFCNGQCPSNAIEVSRDKDGDGHTCWFGTKAYCKSCCKWVSSTSTVYKWFGTAPFCNGQCPSGWTYIRSSRSGDGATCWWGRKKYCKKTVTSSQKICVKPN